MGYIFGTVLYIFLFVPGAYSSEQLPDGTGTARNKIRVTLSRGDLGAEYRCNVESDALDQPMSSWLRIDVHGKFIKNFYIFEAIILLSDFFRNFSNRS